MRFSDWSSDVCSSDLKLHIAPDRQPAHLPPRAVAVAPAGDLAAESDRKAVHLGAEGAAHEEMAQLVNEHERADHRHEHYGGEEQSWLRQEIHQQCLSRTTASARILASRSQASTSSSAATSWTPTLATVCSTTESRKSVM